MSDSDEDKVCNNCKRDIPAANLDLHLSHCIKNLRLCTLCDDPIPIRQFEEHIKEEHAELECVKCKTKFQQGDEDLHQSVCPEAQVLCQFCEVDFPRRVLPSHVNACGSRTEACEGCGDRVMLRDMDVHVCRPRREAHTTRLAATDVTRTSTSPYALQPLNTETYTNNFLHNGIGSTVDLDAALAAQIAHDEQRQNISSNNHTTRPTLSEVVTRTQRPRSNDSENMMLPCEFCEAMFPIEELILHQTGCLDNSITISNPVASPSDQINEVHDSFIPCEFCCKQFPLSLIAQHQAGCTPTRRAPAFPDIQVDRPIRPAGPRGTANTGPPASSPGTRTANSGPATGRSNIGSRPSNSVTRANNPTSRTTTRSQAGRNKPNAGKRRVPARNNRPVLPDSSTSGEGPDQNNQLSVDGRHTNSKAAITTANEARGIRKELVPKPKMTLPATGKEPAKVKNTRVVKTNNMNDLGKASTSRSVPAVVVPKRRAGANLPKSGANISSSDNNSSETWPTLSPKIMNKNPRHHTKLNGNGSKTTNGSLGNDSGKGTQNNFPGASKKTASSKDFKINVTSTENRRVRANILNKYQKDKTLVVSGSNSKSDENS